MTTNPDDEAEFRRPQRPTLDDPPSTPRAQRRDEPPVDPSDHPAPVVTETGTFGTLPEDEPLPDLGGDGWLRSLALRTVSFALFVVAAAWLLVLSAHQVTDRVVAIPALERGVAALTELDALLLMHRDAIAAAGASRAADPVARVEVPGFPIAAATLTAVEARDLGAEEQRALVLERAATAIYERGVDALLVDGGTAVDAGMLSAEGFAGRLLSALTAGTHERVGEWLRVIGLVAIGLAAGVLLLGRGFGRFGALALPLLGAAALGVAAAFALRLAAAVAGGEGDLANELSAIAQGLAWTPARNASWFAAAAAAVALPAMLGGLLLGARDDDLGRHDDTHELDAEVARAD